MKIEDIEKDAEVIITLAVHTEVESVYMQLKQHGIDNVYRFLNIDNKGQEGDFISFECVKLYFGYKGNLLYVEMHAVDYCNLNCRGVPDSKTGLLCEGSGLRAFYSILFLQSCCTVSLHGARVASSSSVIVFDGRCSSTNFKYS